MDKKLVTVSNESGIEKSLVINDSCTFPKFIKAAKNKLGIKGQVMRVSNKDGSEFIEGIEQITHGSHLVLYTGPIPITSRENTTSEVSDLKWVTASDSGGCFALRGRPKAGFIFELPTVKCTHIFTLQSEREAGDFIGKKAKEAGIGWVWLPMGNADPPRYSDLIAIHQKVNEVCHIIKNGGHVLIHCAAGLHRTGMIANIILRYLGFSDEESLSKIKEARQKTFDLCGEHRFAVAESFVKICGNFFCQTPLENLEQIIRENAGLALVIPQQRKGKKGKGNTRPDPTERKIAEKKVRENPEEEENFNLFSENVDDENDCEKEENE